jgi:hypothetical protein
MYELFNNREVAVFIWVSIFLCWAFTKEGVRIAIKQLILAFCNRAILTIFTLMAGYVYLSVDFLSDSGLWGLDQLKNTIMWFIFVASVELFKTNKIYEEKDYFKESIKGHFKLLVVLEFIVAFHSFSLITELIVVPLTTLAAVLLAFSELKDEYKSVENIMSWVLSIFGIFIIGFGLYFIFSNFSQFAQSKTFMDFAIPVILSVLLLPFIYVISVYMRYERILIRVNIYTGNRFYRIYAKIKALMYFKRDHRNLNEWLSYSCMSDFESRKTINESIISFKVKKEEMV